MKGDKNMKRISATLLSAAIIATATGCTTDVVENREAADLLTQVKTAQYFTDEKVSDEDIEKILSAGVNAPSAMNTQPWHFTAVTDDEVTQIIADAMEKMKPPTANDSDAPKSPEGSEGFAKAATKAGIGDAPLTIVISCEDGAELSAGLAVQNMAVEAQLLGYGTKILTSPTIALNGDNQAEYKMLLNIPENQAVAAVLIVGVEDVDNPDALSSATTRNDYADMVTVIGE